MKLHDKRYFVSYRGARSGYSANALLKNGLRHAMLRELSVKNLVTLRPGVSDTFSIWIGDDMAALARENIRPLCVLTADTTIPEGYTLKVEVNGHPAVFTKADGVYHRYGVQPDWLVCGENHIRFLAVANEGKHPLLVRDTALDITFPR